jgi:hypothetical protein
MVWPRFPASYWSLEDVTEIVPERSLMPPLGLITVAALCPKQWAIRLAARVPLFPPMQGETLERWQRVCKEAAAEQDPHRFLELTREILRMLTEKEQRLQQVRAKKEA